MPEELAKPGFLGNVRPINWSNFFLCLYVSMGQLAFGYPASIISTTAAKPSFLLYMGLYELGGPVGIQPSSNFSADLGLLSGIFQAGAFFGVLFGAYFADKFGRKGGFIYAGLLGVIAGACLVGSVNYAMFTVFRFFAGAGSWAFLALTPVYTAELAPPDLRGFFVGMNGVMIGLGYTLAAWVGTGFAKFDETNIFNNNQWRGPLAVGIFFPLLMMLPLPLIPESPRYLLMKNREDQAWDVVNAIHGNHQSGDPNHHFARKEFFQMKKQVELDRTLDPSWIQMFRRPSYRKRAFMAIIFAFIGQSTAILVVNNYFPEIATILGYGNFESQELTAGWLTMSLPGNFFGALFMDRMGRRPLLLFGIGGCCITLAIFAAIVAELDPLASNAKAMGQAGIAVIYIYILIYSVGVDVAGVVWYGELFPNHLRAKGLALSIGAIALTDLMYLQVTPIALANIGWKFFMVFVSIMAVGFIWAWFNIVETKGVPLEEIAALFGDKDEVLVYMKELEFAGDDKLVIHHGDEVKAADERVEHADRSSEEKHL